MKRALISVCAVLGIIHAGMAQPKKGDMEIGVSYGIITTPQIVSIGTNIATFASTAGFYYPNSTRYSGAISAFGKYNISDKLKIGGSVTYELEKKEPWLNSNNTKHEQGHILISNYSIMPSGTFTFLNKKYVQLYSEVALGIGIQYEAFKPTKESTEKQYNKTSSYFAYHVSPIGIRVGGKLAGFVEAGFGYRGIVTSGISYRF